MAHIQSIAQGQDRVFLRRVLDDSIECGYLRSPESWRTYKVTHYEYSHSILGPELCICCIGGGGRDDKLGIVIAAIFFVFSFFVGIFYTSRSIQSAVQADQDLARANYEKSKYPQVIQDPNRPLPPYSPQAYMPPLPAESSQPRLYPVLAVPSAPPQFQAQEITATVGDLYADAALILEGRKKERVATALVQGILTIGAGLLTVALLVTLVAEANLFTVATGTSGAGLLFVGLIAYLVKVGSFTKAREQEAAERLAYYLTFEKNGV